MQARGTANSLEAASEYVRGQNLVAEGRSEEAIAAYQKAVEIDPDLGRAWSGLGAAADNLRRRDEATKYYAVAMSKIDCGTLRAIAYATSVMITTKRRPVCTCTASPNRLLPP